MSDTLHLACLTCRVELWIGQGGYSAPAKAYLYDTDEAKAKFAAFYDAHQPRDGHDVRLLHLEGLYDHGDDWTEFGEEPEPEPDEPPHDPPPPEVIHPLGKQHIPEGWGKMKPGDPVTITNWPNPGDVTHAKVAGKIELRGNYFDLTGDDE